MAPVDPPTAPPARQFRRGGPSRNRRLPTRFRDPLGYPNLSNDLEAARLRNRLTALVVDGHRYCRRLQKGILQYHGIYTQAVNNGQAAIDLLASGNSFNLIIIDIMLPVLNGIETTRRIRAMGIHSKIVGITAGWLERDRIAFLDAGADDFIEKPLTPAMVAPLLVEFDAQH